VECGLATFILLKWKWSSNAAAKVGALSKCKETPIVFQYQHNFDENGIIHFLGAEAAQQVEGAPSGSKAWLNPAMDGGSLIVTRSSDGVGKASDITGRDNVSCHTSGKKCNDCKRPSASLSRGNGERLECSQWWMIDFGKSGRVRPSKYSLRHGCPNNGWALRSWRLEASIDGQNWVVLRTHQNDCSLDAAFGNATWAVDNNFSESTTYSIEKVNLQSGPYRYLCIINTGMNSTGTDHVALSGMEVYGEFYAYMKE